MTDRAATVVAMRSPLARTRLALPHLRTDRRPDRTVPAEGSQEPVTAPVLAPSEIAPSVTSPIAAEMPRERTDVAYALSRGEADRLAVMLDPAGDPAQRTAFRVTPARLRTAVEVAVPDAAVEVVRLPGALHAPETWHVRLTGIDPSERSRLDALVRSARGSERADDR